MKIQPVQIVAILDAKDPGPEFVTLLSRLSRSNLVHIKVVSSLLARKLISVSWNWFVFREIDLCFGKLICVLENWFVFWKINFCFWKLFCALGNWFVFWETVTCFEKLICVWAFWATIKVRQSTNDNDCGVAFRGRSKMVYWIPY